MGENFKALIAHGIINKYVGILEVEKDHVYDQPFLVLELPIALKKELWQSKQRLNHEKWN